MSSPPDGRICVEENEPDGIYQLDYDTLLNTSKNKYASRQSQRWLDDDIVIPVSFNSQSAGNRQSVDMLDTTMFDEFFEMGDSSISKDDVNANAGQTDILLAPDPKSVLLANSNRASVTQVAIASHVPTDMLNKTQFMHSSMEETSVLQADGEIIMPTDTDKTHHMCSSMEESSILQTDLEKPVEVKVLSNKTNPCVLSMDLGDHSSPVIDDVQAAATVTTNQVKIDTLNNIDAKAPEMINNSAMDITLMNDASVAVSPHALDINVINNADAKGSSSSILSKLQIGPTVGNVAASTIAVKEEEEKTSAHFLLQKLQNSSSFGQQKIQVLQRPRRSSVMNICNSSHSDEEDSGAGTESENLTSSIELNAHDNAQRNAAQIPTTTLFQSRLWQREVSSSAVLPASVAPLLSTLAKDTIVNENCSSTLPLPVPASTVTVVTSVQYERQLPPEPTATSTAAMQPQLTKVWPRLPTFPMTLPTSLLGTAGGTKVTIEQQTRKPEALKTSAAAPISSLEDCSSPRKKGRLEGGDDDLETALAHNQLSAATMFATKTLQFQARNKLDSDQLCIEEGIEDALENFSLPTGEEIIISLIFVIKLPNNLNDIVLIFLSRHRR